MNKTVVSPFSSFGKEEWSKAEGGRKNNVYSYFSVNERVIHSPYHLPLRVLLLPEGGDLRYY